MGTFWKMQSLSLSTLLLAVILCIGVFQLAPVSGSEHSRNKEPRQYLTNVLCLKNGFIPYPGGVTSKYILCVWIAARGRWYYYVYNCPPGSGFDPGRGLCVLGVTGEPTTTSAPTDATTSGTTSATTSGTTSGTTAAPTTSAPTTEAPTTTT